MFKKTFLMIAFLASAVILTGCAKKEATQQKTVEQKKPAAEQTVNTTVQQGLDQYGKVISFLKEDFAKNGKYPSDVSSVTTGQEQYPVYNYMIFGEKDMIFEVEIDANTTAAYCSNKDMENCNASITKEGVKYTQYKEWVIRTKK